MGRIFYGKLDGVSTLATLLRHNHTSVGVGSGQWGACCGSCGGMTDPSPLLKKQCYCSIYSDRGFAYEAAWVRPLGMHQPATVQARVCKPPRSSDAWGRTEEIFITRVGPLTLERSAYYQRGLADDLQLSLVPALPKSGTVYITESIDYYFDADKGPAAGELRYPPIHPHHSSSLFVGYEQAMTKNSAGPFAAWWPWPAQSSADAARGRYSEVSANSPGWNTDLIECREGRGQETGCFYIKAPLLLACPAAPSLPAQPPPPCLPSRPLLAYPATLLAYPATPSLLTQPPPPCLPSHSTCLPSRPLLARPAAM